MNLILIKGKEKIRNKYVHDTSRTQSFGLDVLELPVLVKEVVGISLGDEAALIRLLNEVFVSLLLGKSNGILLRVELDVGALHAIGGRLPSHQRVLPAVTPLQDIPVHAPVVRVPGTGLRSGLRGAVDAVRTVSLWAIYVPASANLKDCIPDSAGLEIGRSAGKDSGWQSGAGLTAIHHALGNRGVLSA